MPTAFSDQRLYYANSIQHLLVRLQLLAVIHESLLLLRKFLHKGLVDGILIVLNGVEKSDVILFCPLHRPVVLYDGSLACA